MASTLLDRFDHVQGVTLMPPRPSPYLTSPPMRALALTLATFASIASCTALKDDSPTAPDARSPSYDAASGDDGPQDSTVNATDDGPRSDVGSDALDALDASHAPDPGLTVVGSVLTQHND